MLPQPAQDLVVLLFSGHAERCLVVGGGRVSWCGDGGGGDDNDGDDDDDDGGGGGDGGDGGDGGGDGDGVGLKDYANHISCLSRSVDERYIYVSGFRCGCSGMGS